MKINGWFVVTAIVLLCAIGLTVAPRSTTVHAQSFAAAIPCYIHTAATIACKDGQGALTTIVINGGTAGTVTLYDIAASGCTGTPGSGKFAVIETIGSTNPVALPYNVRFLNGLCIVTGMATDLTAAVQ